MTDKVHSHFSDYSVEYISNPVDVNTPSDAVTPIGVNWFGAQARGISMVGIQAVDPNRPSTAVLLCAVCDNITNPCFFNGICQDDGTCRCTTGSSGTLCQVTPDRNGFFNTYFNTPEFYYNGGDFCEANCVSTESYSCVHAKIENPYGLFAFGYIGFPNCKDPRLALQILGSPILSGIFERGDVRFRIRISDTPGFTQGASGLEVDLVSGL